MSETDHELIERTGRTGRGDAAAFETLVRRWQTPLSRMLGRLVGPRDSPRNCELNGELEDLSQEVFLRVLKASERYSRKAAFSTWLYRIALNVVRDADRRRRTRSLLRLNRTENLNDAATSEATSPDSAASSKEIECAISEALASLPARLREPLVLKHFAELTFAETAEVLNAPVPTVKSRLRKALTELRAVLKSRGVDETELT